MLICTLCKWKKSNSYFPKDKRRLKGHSSICKDCSYKISQESKSKNRQKYRDYIRNYMRKYLCISLN